jgi:hypothetical protein
VATVPTQPGAGDVATDTAESSVPTEEVVSTVPSGDDVVDTDETLASASDETQEPKV